MPVALKSILDMHPDLVCRYGTDYVITYANRAAADFFRTTQSDLIGTDLMTRVPEDQRASVQERLAMLTFESPSGTSVHEVQRESGPVYILWTNIAILDGNAVTSFQSVGRDITAEVRMQREIKSQARQLEEMQRELRAVLDAVPSMIWYKDDRNNILRLNAAAAESMGLAVEEVEGRNTYDLFGDAAKAYHEDDLEVIRSGLSQRGKIEPFTPLEGEQGWIQTDKILLLDEGTEHPRLLVVSSDVTARIEQENMLKTINKNLDDFASLTSHDLQAPLRKIGISAELMSLEYADAMPDGAKEYINDIADGVTHMRKMIHGFLRFMRASPSGVDLEDVDLGAILDDVVSRERDLIEQAGGRIELPENPIHVAGDPALLGQVFTNLVHNAVKYRSPDRPLHIAITAQRDHQFWALDVTDNGSGIDPAQTDKVFDLFGRSKPHPGVEGSGVGLALCRRILSMHGGSIDLHPQPATIPGTRFRVRLNNRRKAA